MFKRTSFRTQLILAVIIAAVTLYNSLGIEL